MPGQLNYHHQSHTIVAKTMASTASLYLVVIVRGTFNHSSYFVRGLRVRDCRRSDRNIQVVQVDGGNLVERRILERDMSGYTADGGYQTVTSCGNASGIAHSEKAEPKAWYVKNTKDRCDPTCK